MAHLSENTAGILDVKSEPGTYLLCSGAGVCRATMEIAASFLVAGKKVFWVDGDNSFNPYILIPNIIYLGNNYLSVFQIIFM